MCYLRSSNLIISIWVFINIWNYKYQLHCVSIFILIFVIQFPPIVPFQTELFQRIFSGPQQAEKVGVKTVLFADDLIIWSSQKINKTVCIYEILIIVLV